MTKKLSPDATIKIRLEHLITYSIFLITFGASIYTLYNTLPKISELSKGIQEIQNNETALRTDIEWLKKFIDRSNKDSKEE